MPKDSKKTSRGDELRRIVDENAELPQHIDNSGDHRVRPGESPQAFVVRRSREIATSKRPKRSK